MAVTLPYAFDTSSMSKVILKGICVLVGIVVIPGLIEFLIIAPNPMAALGIACIGGFLSYFGYVVVKHLCGATGVITREEIFIKPNGFLGMACKEPEGRFMPCPSERSPARCPSGRHPTLPKQSAATASAWPPRPPNSDTRAFRR
jgi:hypothetical protein